MAGSSTTAAGRRPLGSAALAAAITVAAALAVVVQSACTSDEPSVRASRRGEACRVTNDCAEGLACSPVPGGLGGGVCVTGEFRVIPTAKECAIVECATALDCCEGVATANCARLRTECANDAGVDPRASCETYAALCRCESGRVDCERGKCVSHCELDRDCSLVGAGRRCAGGKCVQCALDGDCAAGFQCVTGRCAPPCGGDGDCAGFDRCVAGRCVASGCQADRECVAATRVVDARCGTDGKCIVPCETDLECGSPTGYSFFSCIDRRCTYVGCESDKDCRIFFTGASDASTLPAKQHPVCREPGLGDVLAPGP
jgi:Cys-rich repeat protein